jgi:capsular exopolysaccharide synthesis family protein
MAESVGIASHAGISTVLTGRDDLESAIVPHPQVENVFVLPSGTVPTRPSELLGSQQMRDLLRLCREKFNHIIIDSPPVLSVTDAVILSTEADAVMLVLRSGRTSKHALRRARELLSYVGAPPIGLILNAVDLKSPDSYYYSYGKYRSYYRNDAQ